MAQASLRLDVLVVLGCRVSPSGPSSALHRRLAHARRAQSAHRAPHVLMSGGKPWHGALESEVMAAWWRQHVEDPAELLLERDSQTTRENALYSAQLLGERGLSRVGLVTCDFHMTRAAFLFRRAGLDVLPLPAVHPRSPQDRLRLLLREWGATGLNWLEKPPDPRPR